MVELITDRGTLKEQVGRGAAPVLTLVLDKLSLWCLSDRIGHKGHLELDSLEFSWLWPHEEYDRGPITTASGLWVFSMEDKNLVNKNKVGIQLSCFMDKKQARHLAWEYFCPCQDSLEQPPTAAPLFCQCFPCRGLRQLLSPLSATISLPTSEITQITSRQLETLFGSKTAELWLEAPFIDFFGGMCWMLASWAEILIVC